MDLLTRLVKETGDIRGGQGLWHPKARETMGRDLREAMPIRIQNVADYLYTEIDQEQFHFEESFPNIAPPWPKFFMWFKFPTVVRSQGKVRQHPLAGCEMGYLFLAIDNIAAQEKARWGVNCEYFIVGPALTACALAAFKVTNEGRYFPWNGIDDPKRLSLMQSPLFSWPDGKELENRWMQEAMHVGITSTLTPALLAVSFCHCKNVTIKTAKIPDGVVAKRTKKHGWSPTEIHELEIAPMRKMLHETGGSDLKRSLHIMRGHFKDYRDGRGLFGRVHGMFWWDFRLTDPSHAHRYTVETSGTSETKD